jgi:hypothetical protein
MRHTPPSPCAPDRYVLGSRMVGGPDDYVFVYYRGTNDAWYAARPSCALALCLVTPARHHSSL